MLPSRTPQVAGAPRTISKHQAGAAGTQQTPDSALRAGTCDGKAGGPCLQPDDVVITHRNGRLVRGGAARCCHARRPVRAGEGGGVVRGRPCGQQPLSGF